MPLYGQPMVGFTYRINVLLDHNVLDCAVEIPHSFCIGGRIFNNHTISETGNIYAKVSFENDSYKFFNWWVHVNTRISVSGKLCF